MTLSDPITNLKGVGEKRAKLYKKIGIETVGDLLDRFPRGYIDYTSPVSISETVLNEYNVICCTVKQIMQPARIRKGLTVFKIIVTDSTDDLTVVIYNNPYAADVFKADGEFLLYGKVTGGFTRKEMNSPQVIRGDADSKILPLYHLTEGLTNPMIITNVKEAISSVGHLLVDYMPREILSENTLCTREYAVENIHFPMDDRAIILAKKRLAFDEFFFLRLGMSYLKNHQRTKSSFKMKSVSMAPFEKSLPFELTNAQKKAVSEIYGDMLGGFPMNRLVQGDVGSGKTAVAAAACYFAAENGCQAALMAPTEILAAQHFNTLSAMLEPLGIKTALLTGSLSVKEKNAVRRGLKSGEIQVVAGTHALISKATEFSSLALVITDEQHRFGVNQRAMLADKGANPHKLVMSATPIPRTLALMIYGDLDISVLNELPKGRQPVDTFAVTGKLRERAYGFVRKQLDEGRQGYIVCPLITDIEGDSELIAAEKYAEDLKNGAFKDYSVGLLHGKMSPAEKDEAMQRFKDGETALLVATTVVEVGVDVPNAAIMVIENSDRFGLSQLHQLRGRVGRGQYKSYCILITDNPTEETRQRLKIISSTSDGFKIAEEDLKLRGSGDFFGDRQHGLPPLKFAEMSSDREFLNACQNAAKKITDTDPMLEQHPKLLEAVLKMFECGENGLN